MAEFGTQRDESNRPNPFGFFGPTLDHNTRRRVKQGFIDVIRQRGATLDTEINDRAYKLRSTVGLDNVQTLADDATPSVDGGGMFQTGGTTAITDFDDGQVGDVLYIEAKHSVTITHGTPIQLNGDANYAMVDGDTLVLAMWEDQVWHEVARGGQSAGGGGGAQCATIVIGPSSNSDSDDYDYVTDGTDDDVQIQAAIDANPSSRILLREGTYTIGTTVDFSGSDDNIVIEGMGTGTIITLAASVNSAMFDNTTSGSLPYTAFKNIKFDGNSGNQTNSSARAINWAGKVGAPDDFLLIENCWFEDFYDNCIQTSDAAHSIVSNCYFTTWGQGDTTEKAINDALVVTNCYFDIQSGDTTVRAFGVRADGVASNNRVIVANTWNGSSMVSVSLGGSLVGNVFKFNGLGASAKVLVGLNRTKIQDNRIDGGSANAASIGIQAEADNIVISGNSIQDVGIGISVEAAADDNVVITGNNIYTVEGTAIYCVGSFVTITGNTISLPEQHGIHLDAGANPSYCTVTGNTIEEPGRGTDNTYDGIFIDNTNNAYDVVNGNTVIGAASGNQPRYAINENTNAGPSIITSNVALNGSTGNINTSHVNTINANNLTS